MAEDLTVVIANLGQATYLRPCLASLFKSVSDDFSLRVIVGFNFPGDSETPRTIAAEFPQVEQLRAPTKLGYCRAYNQLMERCTSRYVLLLDDDTIMPTGTLEGMVSFMDAHPDVGIAGCRTLNLDGSYQKSTALTFSIGMEMQNILRPAAFWDDGIDETVRHWRPAEWLNGHFMLVRSDVLQKVGGLDEHYYTFQCEADWCLRIHRAGWTVAYVPEFEVVHARGEHSNKPGVKSLDNLLRSHVNRYYFIRKHYGTGAFLLFRAIMSFGAALRLAKFSLLWLLNADRRPEAASKVVAFWRTILMGVSARPYELPRDAPREAANLASFRPISSN